MSLSSCLSTHAHLIYLIRLINIDSHDATLDIRKYLCKICSWGSQGFLCMTNFDTSFIFMFKSHIVLLKHYGWRPLRAKTIFPYLTLSLVDWNHVINLLFTTCTSPWMCLTYRYFFIFSHINPNWVLLTIIGVLRL